MPGPKTVWLIPPDSEQAETDIARATALGIPVTSEVRAPTFYLARKNGVLHLCRQSEKSRTEILLTALDHSKDQFRRQSGGRQSPLAKALGLHRHASFPVLDTTAGLARDATTLAALGCPVTAIEREPALYALLADATDRIDQQAPRPVWWPNWQQPVHADALTWLHDHGEVLRFDAIYIDPMFCSPRRKSRPQKALAWLAELAGQDQDTPQLLAEARRHAGRRVVVKQHARAAPLAPPDLQVRGRAIRFDIYLTG